MRFPFASSLWCGRLSILVFLILAPTPVLAQVGINVFGLSHHFENDFGKMPESFNPGLGLHWTFDRGSLTSLEVNAGMYRDSFHQANRHLSLGGRLRLWGPLEVGLHAVLAKSPSVNGGQALIHPIPFLSLRHPRFVLSSVYIPEVGYFNTIPTLAFTATVFPFGHGFQWEDPRQRHTQRRSALEFGILNLVTLQGYRDLGIAWRRMFNPRHGLRLGFDLEGVISLGHDTPFGSYDTRILIQYLRLFSAGKRSRCLMAGGARIGFEEDFGHGVMQYDLLLNLGWEYYLGSSFGIFVETGLVWQWGGDGFTDWDFFGTPTSSSLLKSDGITLGLTAWL